MVSVLISYLVFCMFELRNKGIKTFIFLCIFFNNKENRLMIPVIYVFNHNLNHKGSIAQNCNRSLLPHRAALLLVNALIILGIKQILEVFEEGISSKTLLQLQNHIIFEVILGLMFTWDTG